MSDGSGHWCHSLDQQEKSGKVKKQPCPFRIAINEVPLSKALHPTRSSAAGPWPTDRTVVVTVNVFFERAGGYNLNGEFNFKTHSV